MLSGDIEEHSGDAACKTSGIHVFVITTAKAATLDAEPPEYGMVLISNDAASVANLTAAGNGNDIGSWGANKVLEPGERFLAFFNGTKWLVLAATVDLPAGGVTDHGALDGLSDDDHAQYSKADGTRAFTAVVTGVAPTSDLHLATKKYVDDSGGGGGPAQVSDIQAARDTSVSTTLADTELEVTLVAGKKYMFKAFFHVNSVSSAGWKIGFAGTATVQLASVRFAIRRGTSLRNNQHITTTGFMAWWAGMSESGNDTLLMDMQGYVEVDGSGTFKIQYARQAEAGSTQFDPLSYIHFIEIA